MEIESNASKDDKGNYGLKKTIIMDAILKQCLGIDVSKSSLSLSLGSLTKDLNKKFENHVDVGNDLSGFKVLHKWLKGSLVTGVDFIIVMEATGVYHQHEGTPFAAQLFHRSVVAGHKDRSHNAGLLPQACRQERQSVIVKVARKLLSRTLAVMKTEIPYAIGIIECQMTT